MKKFLLSLTLIITLMLPSSNVYAMNAKTKAFLVMCTYGTVGGALLGFASMAFGTNSRAIAQGASLGLYAGIIFGSYVITSHRSAGQQDEYYDYPAPPPSSGFGAPAPSGFGQPAPTSGGGFFDMRVMELNQKFNEHHRHMQNKRENFNVPPLYLNIYNTTF
jgi:hypothetical protein